MSIRIVCTEGHDRPHIVMDLQRQVPVSTGMTLGDVVGSLQLAGRDPSQALPPLIEAGWVQVTSSSAKQKRGSGLLPATRPERIVELRDAELAEASVRAAGVPRFRRRDSKATAVREVRAVFPIKCDRCGWGRDRRAERLYPVLDALESAGRTEVTIREFWAVADAMDSRRRR